MTAIPEMFVNVEMIVIAKRINQMEVDKKAKKKKIRMKTISIASFLFLGIVNVIYNSSHDLLNWNSVVGYLCCLIALIDSIILYKIINRDNLQKMQNKTDKLSIL
jgi:protein-S-isoprenylcysteine O-methyltransferase Ste14